METMKRMLTAVAAYGHLFLFTYAAVSKWHDFANFQIELAQSPLLSAFAGPLSYMVPAGELVLAVLLAFPRTRAAGLYGSFGLMAMFTTYIYVMLHFSPFVPCSCGGILEKMSWTQHLGFNVAFLVLGFAALVCMPTAATIRFRVLLAMGTGVLGGAAVVVLFLLSEDMMHHRNNFTRRFPQHPATLQEIMDLKVNSYYIAGMGPGEVYLGNVTAPLVVTVVDSLLRRKVQHTIRLVPARDQFHFLQLSVRPPYFFLSDGRSPVVCRGTVGEWVARVWTENTAYFNAFEPMDGQRAAFRAVGRGGRTHVLGLFGVGDTTQVVVKPVLEKQTDGIFDTGGTLRYNAEHRKLLYVYTYRNTYLVMDQGLGSRKIQHTIDTTTKVRIRTRFDADTQTRSLASPAWTVNNRARTHKNYLLVHSAAMGQFEPRDMWRRASVIDVYDFVRDRYEFSFYLTKIMDAKMSDFIVGDDKAYAVCGNYLSVYRLDRDFYTKNR